MAYMKKTVVAGRTMEVEKYLLYQRPKRPRACKENPTPEKMAKVNERNARKKLRQLINANFGEGDLHLVLTYRGRAPEPEEAAEHLKRFLRKMRKIYTAAGKELRYVVVTEYKSSRIHHHVVVNKMDVSEIRKLWEHGYLRLSVLDDTGDYHQLAEYLLKETSRTFRESPGGKRWSSSRNLVRPIEKKTTVKRSKFRDPPSEKLGAFRLVHWEQWADEWTGEIHQVGYYLRN